MMIFCSNKHQWLQVSEGVPQEDVHDEEQETVLAPAVPGLLSLPGLAGQSVSPLGLSGSTT